MKERKEIHAFDTRYRTAALKRTERPVVSFFFFLFLNDRLKTSTSSPSLSLKGLGTRMPLASISSRLFSFCRSLLSLLFFPNLSENERQKERDREKEIEREKEIKKVRDEQLFQYKETLP